MENFSDERNMKLAMEFAASEAGKQLLTMLQQNGGEAFQQAMDKAAAGDYTAAKQALSAMMASPEVQKLMKQFGR